MPETGSLTIPAPAFRTLCCQGRPGQEGLALQLLSAALRQERLPVAVHSHLPPSVLSL